MLKYRVLSGIAFGLMWIMLSVGAPWSNPVLAQTGEELVPGEWVNGSLDLDETEDVYTLNLSQDSRIFIELHATQRSLYPFIELRSADETVLMQTGVFFYRSSHLFQELAAGTYSVVVLSPPESQTIGTYALRLTMLEAFSDFNNLTVPIHSNLGKEVADLYPFYLAEDTLFRLELSHPGAVLYPDVRLMRWPKQDPEMPQFLNEANVLLNLVTSLTYVQEAGFTLLLPGDNYYVLGIEQGFYHFEYGDVEVPVNFSLTVLDITLE
jgi:hypothetical protein